jgi:lipid II isoglutaminyl synthase (glutamine-hydrolysing)
MIAPDLAARGDGIRAAVDGGAALLAVCGGYQLLGRGYRGRDGSWMPGAALFPHETVAGETRMIGDVLLESTLEEAPGTTITGFENHAGRTLLDDGAVPLGRVVAGYGNDGRSGQEGCRVGRAIGTYLHGPLLPRNPWLADLLLSWALAHATCGEPEELSPLPDELERQAHAVAAARARTRGGRPA